MLQGITIAQKPLKDHLEAVGYRDAFRYVEELATQGKDLSEFEIKNIHSLVLSDRPDDKGKFRRVNVRIPGALTEPVQPYLIEPKITELLDDFRSWNNSFHIVECVSLFHLRFENIHPFIDGNGRMGRLLITFWLCQQNILSQPLLYISYFFKKNRHEYYDRLMEIRNTGDWEQWIKFFLKGIAETSEEAISTAKEILSLKKVCEDMIVKSNNNYRQLLDFLFISPVTDKQEVAEKLNVSQPTANRIVEQFCELGILVDQRPESKRYKRYAFTKYLAILSRGTEV